MSTELETKLQELRKKVADHWQFAMMPNPELTQKQLIGIFSNLRDKLDDALASLPQQDVGAGRSVPSPVGQEQQNSDVLGDAEDGPRSTLQVLASEGSGLSTAIAIAEVKAMLEEIVSEVLVDNINGAEYNLFVAIAAKRGITLVR